MLVVQVILLVLHLLGVLGLLIGLLVQVRHADRRVTGPMRDGIGTTFLAGLFLVAVLEARDQDVDGPRVATMFGVGLVILVLVMANVRKERIPDRLYWLILLLTVANIGIAYSV
jgi:hypothetical protein